ncbi:MAG: hypothetical protein KAX46_07210 [Chromatiaceae bacterium]|nr:hypothetical protein [Chromatiaceae bacterium]
MGFAGFVASGVTPAVAGALRGRNMGRQQAEEQRRYDTEQARMASQTKWTQQQALEQAQRQAMLDALAREAQAAAVKDRAEGNAIRRMEAMRTSPSQESYQELVGPKGPGVYGVTEGQDPRYLGGVIPKPKSDGGGTMRTTGQLRREFNTFVKPYEGLAQAFRKVNGAASDPSAAGDLSVIFGFMKLLDPPSVVREGEQATAANARGVPETVRAMYNRILTGERLTQAQRADFVRQARNLMGSQQAALTTQVNRYRGIAEANDIDPEQVLYDPFEGILTPTSDGATEPPPAPSDAQSRFEAWKAKQGRP